MPISKDNRDLNPDHFVDIETLIADVVPNHVQWMDTPHALLDCCKTQELIGTSREGFLRDLVLAIKFGVFS